MVVALVVVVDVVLKVDAYLPDAGTLILHRRPCGTLFRRSFAAGIVLASDLPMLCAVIVSGLAPVCMYVYVLITGTNKEPYKVPSADWWVLSPPILLIKEILPKP